MRILALNVTHDSSVCVLNDGQIEYFGKEERFSGIKRDHLPVKSLLEYFKNFSNKNIDFVLFLSPTLHQNDIGVFNTFKILIQKFRKVNSFEIYCENSHHDLHAWLSYVNSGFTNTLVFVIDRNGAGIFTDTNSMIAREAESIFLLDQGNLKPVYKNFWCSSNIDFFEIKFELGKMFPGMEVSANSPYSIVKVYEAATSLIGQHPLENGKTMGLSSYGKTSNTNYFDNFGKIINSKFVHLKDSNQSVIFSNHKNKITKDITKENYQFYADRALEVQTQTQKQVLNLIEKFTKKYKIENVCLVGGYGLNIIANSFYIKNLPKIKFYFEPVSDDTGITIGACFKKYYEITKKNPNRLKNNFFHFFNENERLVADKGKKASVKDLINLLLEGKSLGLFDGSPEAGPRALGHRSILLDPRLKDGREKINKIKKREWYRPFAGVILKEDLEQYFYTNGISESPYMTINFDCKDVTKDTFPSIVHIDNTCRIQTIDDSKTFIFEILKEFKSHTGFSILLNTSLNLAGKPLTHSKNDALNLFFNSELDSIFFVQEQLLFTKEQNV